MKQRAKSGHHASSALGQIRIIGGRWRGRKLAVVNALGLRPTTDRIKETVFNWLQFELNDAQVVDLFAGSGGLGFEALSRGAQYAHFVETWAPAVQQLKRNVQTLNANAEVHTAGALAFLNHCPAASIDILFIDPPFGQAWLDKVLPVVTERKVLTPGAWIYVESGSTETTQNWPANWHLHREKVAGQVCYRLFQYQP